MKNSINRDHVYVFNLSSDLNSPVLAANVEWVKAFALQSKFVNVYSTHLGETPSIENVKFYEIGGGSLIRRLTAISKLAKASISIVRNSKQAIVFHHMSPRTAVLLGPILRLLNVPQGLWYSHSVASVELKIAKYFVNKIFTSSESALPINSLKVKYIGHGISTELFKLIGPLNRTKMSIISVGRVTKIKRLERILNGISCLESNIQDEISTEFVGSVQDTDYKKNLEKIAQDSNLTLHFRPPLKYSDLSSFYNSQSIYFSGTPMSIDKATLEAAICGCFIVSENADALKLTGMKNLYGDFENNSVPSIPDQIRMIYALDFVSESNMRRLVSESTKRQNDVNKTVSVILDSMKLANE